MSESLGIDLADWIVNTVYEAIGPAATSDQYTVNVIHRNDVDGPTEWRERRETYAPPFGLLRAGPIDQRTTALVRSKLHQEREYKFTLIFVAMGPAAEAEQAARIIADRAYNDALRFMGSGVYGLPAADSGEHATGLEIGQIRQATFPEFDGSCYALAYVPLVIQSETGTPPA